MGWISLCVAVAALLLVVSVKVWRRWIEPWREVDELLADINEGRPPRKFLMTGNSRARPIGLSLEKLAERLREAERAAHEGTLSIQTILSALPDGLVVVDERQRVQMTNAEFRQMFALGEDAGAGVPLLEITRDAAVDQALRTALSERTVRTASLNLMNATAAPRQLELNVVPFEENAKRTAGAVVLLRDVTQVRQVEEMRRDFVANVSHELRTPLSIFRGYLETLLDDPQQPAAELVRILEVMERHSDRLTNLVDDVLSLARLEAPQTQLDLTEVNVVEFLASILRDWEKRFVTKQIRPELSVSADLPLLHADEGRLQEVIYNLLDNALKYSPAHGVITLNVEAAGDDLRLSVADQGPGIPARDLPRIFERFYRADKARSRAIGGTGLGLAIVKHIAQLHGGRVEAHSAVGAGAKVSVILPIGGSARAVPVTES